ncbi:MAG: GNAT family N-acetyltransferase [Christensenella sp.]|nr:GNAT family N-acetyltransferase [Christensenella sp.]
MKQQILRYLERDTLANIDMIGLLPLPAAEVLRWGEAGVLLRHGTLYLLAAEEGCANEFLPLMTRGLMECVERQIIVRSGELIPQLTREYGFFVSMECRHAVYPSAEPIPYSLPEGAEIRPLDVGYLDFVHAHYHMVDDAAYLRERLEAGMFGVFVGGRIAGFIGTHEEQTMGLLEILPDYRRLGLAYALEAHLINHLLSIGQTPFCQVAIHNEPSLRLQKKLGLTLSETVVNWLTYPAK